MPHAVTLKLYNTASPANAIYKALGTAVTVQDVLLPPSFDYQSGDAVRFTVATTGSDWNYVELSGTPSNEAASRTWYYFIDRVECLGGTTGSTEGGYVAHLRLDPLMTYKQEIELEGLYVARNEVDYDINIIDNALPQYYKQIRETAPDVYNIDPVATPNNPCIIFETISQYGVYVYVMTPQEFMNFSSDFWGPHLPALLSDPQSCVIRCFLLPYSKNTIGQVFPVGGIAAIRIGSKLFGETSEPTYYYLTSETLRPQIIRTITVNLPRDNVGWKSKDDHYKLYIPYCGVLDLAGTEIYFDNSSEEKSIQIDFVLDVVTGDVTAEIAPTDPMSGNLHYSSGNMAIPIPFTSNNATQRFISGMSGLVSSGMAAASMVVNPSAGSAALLASAGVSNISAMRESVNVNGTFGGTTSWGLPQNVFGYYWRNEYGYDNSNFARTHGRPLYQTRHGSALSGFTICENVHIQPADCPATVAAEIKRLLESGVYFDDGQ